MFRYLLFTSFFPVNVSNFNSKDDILPLYDIYTSQKISSTGPFDMVTSTDNWEYVNIDAPFSDDDYFFNSSGIDVEGANIFKLNIDSQKLNASISGEADSFFYSDGKELEYFIIDQNSCHTYKCKVV